ncbi:MAG: glycerophosphodiester phosphodiesterase [Spirochaetia bacterium]|jgi:glycerophosphoryl diester phosphodiesterase|nr:glycerophosphodiester phosphodiesterase [Spirochaetia bacterium]
MRTLVTAHSGCENTNPNSMEYILAAIKCGADAAEIDIRITKDRIPVLSHDDGFQPSASFSEISIAENIFRDLTGIVSLPDLLLATGKSSIHLNLDIKDFSSIDAVIALLKKTGTYRRTVFSGFTALQVRELKKSYPDAGFMINISEEFVPENMLMLFHSDKKAYTDYLTDIYRETGGICLNMSFEYCDIQILDTLRKRYVPVSIWTIDDINLMREYAESGAYSITTRKVKTLLEIISG